MVTTGLGCESRPCYFLGRCVCVCGGVTSLGSGRKNAKSTGTGGNRPKPSSVPICFITLSKSLLRSEPQFCQL